MCKCALSFQHHKFVWQLLFVFYKSALTAALLTRMNIRFGQCVASNTSSNKYVKRKAQSSVALAVSRAKMRGAFTVALI